MQFPREQALDLRQWFAKRNIKSRKRVLSYSRRVWGPLVLVRANKHILQALFFFYRFQSWYSPQTQDVEVARIVAFWPERDADNGFGNRRNRDKASSSFGSWKRALFSNQLSNWEPKVLLLSFCWWKRQMGAQVSLGYAYLYLVIPFIIVMIIVTVATSSVTLTVLFLSIPLKSLSSVLFCRTIY